MNKVHEFLNNTNVPYYKGSSVVPFDQLAEYCNDDLCRYIDKDIARQLYRVYSMQIYYRPLSSLQIGNSSQ